MQPTRKELSSFHLRVGLSFLKARKTKGAGRKLRRAHRVLEPFDGESVRWTAVLLRRSFWQMRSGRYGQALRTGREALAVLKKLGP